MKTLVRFILVLSLSLLGRLAFCQEQEYQKIQLKDPFTSIEKKSNYNIWRTDYYICTGIAYSKSQGGTVEDFMKFVGTHHSWSSIKGKGIEPAVRILNGLIKLYGNGEFEILSESDTLVTMQSNRPYFEYFKNGTMLGVSLDEFESCLWGHIIILADRIGLIFKYNIEGDQILSSLRIKK